MVTKKPPAITHSARIPVDLSTKIQHDADEMAGGNFSSMLITMIDFYYEAKSKPNKRTKK